MNKILLIGRLTRDPEMKVSNDGVTQYVAFTLAINRGSKNNNNSSSDNDGEFENITREADFIPVVAFDKRADYICTKARKGSLVSISGSLRVYGYQDKNGERKHYTDVIAYEFHYLSPGKSETKEDAM